MTGKQAYIIIDKVYQSRLSKSGLAYNLRKTKNSPEIKIQLGKFEKVSDPYYEKYIPTCCGEDYILDEFLKVLEIAEKEA